MQVPDTPTVDRRTVLASTGGLVVGGGLVATLTSQPAAAVSISDELNIPEQKHAGKDGTPERVTLQVQGPYQWTAPDAATLRFRLQVSRPGSDDWAAVDETTHGASGTSGSGTYDLAGAVTDHPGIAIEDFAAGPEETNRVPLAVQVRFDVLDADDAPIVEAGARTDTAVVVENTSIKAEALVQGDGSIGIEL